MLCENISKKIEELLLAAGRQYFQDDLPTVKFPEEIDAALQVTKDFKHGDLTSNIAMRLAGIAKKPPPVLGESILKIFRKKLEKSDIASYVRTAEITGGFINFWLSDEYLYELLLQIKKKGPEFGRSNSGEGKKINLEFVSANPTGPLTIAHGRQAAIGDALSSILKFNGYDVTDEYYLNDFGRQINLLGRSVEVRYRNLFGEEEPMPEDGYMGAYISGIAEKIKSQKGDSLLEGSASSGNLFREFAVERIMGLITKDLDDFGVKFDVWTSQAEMEKNNGVEKAMKLLEDDGYLYEEDGAKWFASTRFGDDKDRVVVKSDGAYTYLAPDIAYHMGKYLRGFDRIIDILGPDHHGYIGRMEAAVQALGYKKSSLDILIVQLVTLMRHGKNLSMSTRKGEFISLREILDEVGPDVTRFYFLSRRLDSHLDFDIDLAKKESSENPVYYMQYAHARICSIKKYSRKNRLRFLFRKTDLFLMTEDAERQLMRKLGEFSSVVKTSAEILEPNRLIVYLNELARCFHSFYTECRVVSDDMALSKARLFLVECVRIVLANGLGLLKITLPEKM